MQYLAINSSVQAARVAVPSCAQRSDAAEHPDIALQVLHLIVQLAVFFHSVSVLVRHLLQVIHLEQTPIESCMLWLWGRADTY